ncbi:MAG: redoxin domain-containing protein [Gemmatimonadota bacterium]
MSTSVAFRATMLASVMALVALAPSAAQTQAGQAAPPPPAPATPAVGDAAPDFTATATDSTGKTIPVSLASMRGKVVVIAFYPADRTSGCTAELTKFRDEYKTLFGDGVAVLPTSIDSVASHASWARDAHFPFAMIADTKGDVAVKYGAQRAPGRAFSRSTYVIGKDGKIVYAEPRFNALAQDGYDKLAAAIKQAKGT